MTFRKQLLGYILLVTLTGCQEEATIAPTISPTTESQPVPAYIGRIYPQPGASVSRAEFEQEAPTFFYDPTRLLDHAEAATPVPARPSVCLTVVFWGIVEEGDFLSSEDWLSRMYLVLDGEIIPRPYAAESAYTIPADMIDQDTGASVGRLPEPVSICYEAQRISAGQHTVTFVVEKTSGEKAAYTWSFTITK